MQWRNRIIERRTMTATDLAAHPLNPKVHPPTQLDGLRASLETLGRAQTLRAYYSARNGGALTILDGHARALTDPDQAWEVDVLDFTDADADLFIPVAHRLEGLAELDAPRLDALLRDVSTDDPRLMQLLAEVRAQAGPVLPEPGGGGDEFDTTPDGGPTRVQVGDVWVIGGVHRLVCGDCSDVVIVDCLMDGSMADMVWTDPPYGVGMGEKNRFLNVIVPGNRIEEDIAGDTLSEELLTSLLCLAFDHALAVCHAGSPWYVAAPPEPRHVLFGQVLKERGIWRQTIQWVKNNATFVPLGVDYRWRAEPIFYGWKPGASHRWYGGRQQDTVWEIDRPLASPDHPTTKPVALITRAIDNSSRPGDIVFDGFLGSGTTLIAAHRAGRRCYGCEIAPIYCDVILRRAEAEGLTVDLVERLTLSSHE